MVITVYTLQEQVDALRRKVDELAGKEAPSAVSDQPRAPLVAIAFISFLALAVSLLGLVV